MAIKSKINGDKGERIVANYFSSLRYWVHIIKRNNSGQQPFDIVAIKGNYYSGECDAWLVDAKYVEKGDRFYFEDIQPNQIESMSYARDFAEIPHVGFWIVFGNDTENIYFLPLIKYNYLAKLGIKGINKEEMEKHGFHHN